MKRRLIQGSLMAALTTVIATPLAAETRTWFTDDGDFSDPTNWSPIGVPAASDTIRFGGTNFTNLQVALDRDATVDRMDVRQLFSLDLRATGADRTLTIQHSGADSPALLIGPAETQVGLVRLSSEQNVHGTLVAPSMSFGHGAGSTATVRSQALSSFDLVATATCDVGFAGTALIELRPGGTLDATRLAFGRTATGHGTGRFIGGTLRSSQQMIIGDGGLGEVLITNGSSATLSALSLGERGGSSGSLVVSGASSSCDVTGPIDVGVLGNGEIRVEFGGRLTTETTMILGFLDDAPTAAEGDGSLHVVRADSTVTVNDDLWLGLIGRGTLISEHGGTVSVNGRLRCDDPSNAALVVHLGAANGAPIVDVAGAADAVPITAVLPDDVTPSLGDTWRIIEAAQYDGQELISLPEFEPTWILFAETDATGVSVIATERTDLNHNLTTDFDDLLILLSQWGLCFPELCQADFNASGVIEINDLIHLLANWD